MSKKSYIIFRITVFYAFLLGIFMDLFQIVCFCKLLDTFKIFDVKVNVIFKFKK